MSYTKKADNANILYTYCRDSTNPPDFCNAVSRGYYCLVFNYKKLLKQHNNYEHNPTGPGSHIKLFNNIHKLLKEVYEVSNRDLYDFRSYHDRCKKLRITADYNEHEIQPHEFTGFNTAYKCILSLLKSL